MSVLYSQSGTIGEELVAYLVTGGGTRNASHCVVADVKFRSALQ